MGEIFRQEAGRENTPTYEFFVGEVAIGIRIILILVFIFGLAQRLHQLGVVFALQVRLVLGLERCLLLLLILSDSVLESQIAYRVFYHCAVLLQSFISEGKQVLKRLQGESTHGVLVVVIVILDHVLSVQLDILELFEGLPVVLVHVMRAPSHLLEPHSLVVVDAYIVAAILHEYVHDSNALFDVARFESVHSGNGIYSTIGLVKVSGLFMEQCGLLAVARFLVNLAL